MDYQSLITQIFPIITKAGRETLKYYERDFSEEKGEASPVTEADIASHNELIDGLSSIQGIPVYSEETKDQKVYLGAERYFLIDPLDGTKDFIHKTGDFSVMLALVEGGYPVIGVVYQPQNDTLWYAITGHGANMVTRSGTTKIHVSPETDFQQMKLVVSRFHLREEEVALKEMLHIGEFQQKGSAGLKMCDIANGNAQMYVSMSSKAGEWDSAPGALIVEEAGGIVTDMNGDRLTFAKHEPCNPNGFVASNGTQHDALIEAIQDTLQKKSF